MRRVMPCPGSSPALAFMAASGVATPSPRKTEMAGIRRALPWPRRSGSMTRGQRSVDTDRPGMTWYDSEQCPRCRPRPDAQKSSFRPGSEADLETQTGKRKPGNVSARTCHRREGPRRGLTSLMRPQRPLPTVPFVKKPLRRCPNVCRGDPGGNLPRWFHAHLHSSLAAPALRPTHCLRLEQHEQPEQRHASCQAFASV